MMLPQQAVVLIVAATVGVALVLALVARARCPPDTGAHVAVLVVALAAYALWAGLVSPANAAVWLAGTYVTAGVAVTAATVLATLLLAGQRRPLDARKRRREDLLLWATVGTTVAELVVFWDLLPSLASGWLVALPLAVPLALVVAGVVAAVTVLVRSPIYGLHGAIAVVAATTYVLLLGLAPLTSRTWFWGTFYAVGALSGALIVMATKVLSAPGRPRGRGSIRTREDGLWVVVLGLMTLELIVFYELLPPLLEGWVLRLASVT